MVLSSGDTASMGLRKKSLTPQSGFVGLQGEKCGLGSGPGPPGGWESAGRSCLLRLDAREPSESLSCWQGWNAGQALH